MANRKFYGKSFMANRVARTISPEGNSQRLPILQGTKKPPPGEGWGFVGCAQCSGFNLLELVQAGSG